jgi:quercetin dioxygenase-like cupin family protein
MVAKANTSKSLEQNNDLKRLPWLASPWLKFDLSGELLELRRKDSFCRETGRSSKTLAKHADFRIVLVLMKSDTQMTQHQAEGRISIYQLSGNIRVYLPNQTFTLATGELLVLDGGVLHDIEALEESSFLLTISWRSDRTNPESEAALAERIFDEEALLRMDDEGPQRKRPECS